MSARVNPASLGAALCCALAAAAPEICRAAQLRVTAFKAVHSGAEKEINLTFNHALALARLRLVSNGEFNSFQLPAYEGKNGKLYPEMRILTQRLHTEVLERALAAFKKGPSPTSAAAQKIAPGADFRVGSVALLPYPKRVANVEVVFENELAVVFGILKKPNGAVELLYPGQGSKCFKILDPKLRLRIEKDILAAYHNAIKIEENK